MANEASKAIESAEQQEVVPAFLREYYNEVILAIIWRNANIYGHFEE